MYRVESGLIVKDDLIHALKMTMFDSKYKFLHNTSYPHTDFSIDDHEFHSAYRCIIGHTIRGYIKLSFNIATKTANIDGFAIFGDDDSYLILNMLIDATLEVCMERDIKILTFGCNARNKALRGYKSLIKRFGGRYVGYYTNGMACVDGKISDLHMFEIQTGV